MGEIIGIARISTATQSIDRQIRNIQKIYPTAKIIKIVCSGSKVIGYIDFEKAIKEANHLSNPNALQIGQRLIIPLH